MRLCIRNMQVILNMDKIDAITELEFLMRQVANLKRIHLDISISCDINGYFSSSSQKIKFVI